MVLSFLLKYKNYIALLLAVAALGASFLYIRYQGSQIDLITLQRDQNAAQLKFCANQHIINQEVSNEYQNQLSDLDRRLSDYKRLYNNQCIAVTQPAGGFDAGTTGRPAGGNEIAAGTLFEYAARCEGLRQQVMGLQSYIRRSQ